MIFLIEYDRRAAQTVRLERFSDDQRTAAADARLRLEIGLMNDRLDHEVLLLEAAHEDDLHRTHRRYFESDALKEDVRQVRRAVGE